MFSVATKVFIISILALPLSYTINKLILLLNLNDLSIILVTILSICIISFIILFTTRADIPTQKRHERIDFYIFATFAFQSVVSLIAGLELDGIISGFMSSFLKSGEPYLRSSHGTIICYFNGTVIYAMYLMMIAAITWSSDFYEVALYWFGSIENCILVLLLSIANGKYGLNWGSLLYLPYLIGPPIIIIKLFKYTQSIVLSDNINKFRPIYTRPTDILFVVYLMLSILVSLLRGICVLHHNELSVCANYLKYIEPYLTINSPAPFGKMQMIIYLFYFTPVYMASIYALISPNPCQWIYSLSLIHAGAAMQSQVTHIGSSFHSRTPYIQRVPQDFTAQLIYWTINLTLLIGPQLLSIRCFNVYEFAKNIETSHKNHKSDSTKFLKYH